MNCTSCKKPLAAGATKCAACGAAANYSYDLLPDEPEKKEEGGPGQQYVLPPNAVLPPGMSMPAPAAPGADKKPTRVLRADRARGASMSGGGKTSLFKMGVGAGAVLIVILLGMRMCGGSTNKISGPAAKLADQTITVYSSSAQTRNFEILGKGEYSFTVEAKNGDVSIGVQMRSPKERVTPELVKSWNLMPLKKGESKTLTGELGTGTYSLVIATVGKTGVTVKASGSVK